MSNPGTRPSWYNTMVQNAVSAGVDPDVMWRIAGSESGYGANTANPASSARGPWQITQGTWDAFAATRPSLKLGDRNDPEQSARGAPWLLAQNNATIRDEIGREPTPTEQYLGWFSGPGRAASVINAPAGTPVAKLFDAKALAANAALFAKHTTAGSLRVWAAGRMGAVPNPTDVATTTATDTGFAAPPSHVNPFTSDNVSYATATPAQPTDLATQMARETAARNDRWGFFGAAAEAWWNEGATSWLYRGNNAYSYAPDPHFNVTMDMLKGDKRLEGVDPAYWSDLTDSKSQAEYEYRMGVLKDDLDYERHMADLGVEGLGLRFAGAVLDPAGWLISAVSPLAGGAVKVGRIGRILLAGTEAAIGNTLADMPKLAFKPTYDPAQVAYTAAGSFLFGSALGGFLKPHPSVATEMEQAATAATGMMRTIDKQVASQPPGSGGAALNAAYVEPVREDVHDFLTSNFVSEVDAKRATAAGFDPALSSRLRMSKNPLTSALSPVLVENAIGNGDHSAVARAASSEASDISRNANTLLLRQHKAAFDDFVKRNNVGWFSKDAAWREFNERVTATIENRDAAAVALEDPAIQRAAAAHRSFYANYLKLAKNPGELDGTVRAALPGAAETDANPHYVPHLYDFYDFGKYTKMLGDANMRTLVRESIRAALPGMEKEMLQRVSEGFYRGLRKVGAGQETTVSNMLSSNDRDQLAQFLREYAGLNREDIGYLIEKLKPEEGGAPGRLKQRTALDPMVKVPLKVVDASDPNFGKTINVSMSDFMHRDAIHNAMSYGRQMSARIALARVQVPDPTFRPGVDAPEREFLVNGIKNDSDWEKLLKQVRAVGDTQGMKPDHIQKDVDRLNFAYKAILGRLDSTIERGTTGSVMRTIRNLNFARMMGQVAWAQLAETYVGIGQVGWKAALSQMPTFARLARDAKTGLLKDEVARTLDYIASPGTDHLMSSVGQTFDDLGNVIDKRGYAQAVENVSRKVAHGVSVASGMAHITQVQQQWMARAAMARFAMDATGEKALNMRRMAVLGIDDKMAQKIRDQLQTHAGYVKGESGTDLRALNLDKWSPDARYAFSYALARWTRKMVQENDVGQTMMLMGNDVGKVLMQFRNFMFGAYAKNFLHNIHMRDWEMASGFLGSIILGGLTYVAQTHLQAVGRSDAQNFLDKRLDNKSIVAAALQRAPFTSVLPMATDIASYGFGIDPIFDQRVTGTPAQGLYSNPTFQLVDNVQNASRGIFRSTFTDEQYSQRDARALIGLLPFGNLLPSTMLANSMISGLPEQDTHPRNK